MATAGDREPDVTAKKLLLPPVVGPPNEEFPPPVPPQTEDAEAHMAYDVTGRGAEPV